MRLPLVKHLRLKYVIICRQDFETAEDKRFSDFL